MVSKIYYFKEHFHFPGHVRSEHFSKHFLFIPVPTLKSPRDSFDFTKSSAMATSSTTSTGVMDVFNDYSEHITAEQQIREVFF